MYRYNKVDEPRTCRHINLIFVFTTSAIISSQLPCFCFIYRILINYKHAKLLSHTHTFIYTTHWWIKWLLIFQFSLIINNVIRGCYIIKLYNRAESIYMFCLFLYSYSTFIAVRHSYVYKQKIDRVVVIVISIVFLMILL